MTVKAIDVKLNSGPAVKSVKELKNEMNSASSSAASADKMMQQYNKTLNAIKSSASGMSLHLNKLTGTIGLSLGFKALIGEAHEANMEIWRMHNAVKDMTDQFGDTGKVMNTVWKAYGSSSVSLKETENIIRSLNQAGMEVNSSMSEMAGWIGRVGQASGVNFDVLGRFMGNMKSYWNVSTAGAKEMVHSLFAVKGAYQMNSKQVEELIALTQKVHEELANVFTDGEKSSIALSKGIASAVGTMRHFGVASEKAGAFVEQMLDPKQLSQNTALLRRMGITYRDQVEMMTTEGGKEKFFDKLMTQLPTISNQLASIRDPFVRMNVAKNLGIPMEVASKFAGKTADEIQDQLNLMKDQKKAADVQQKKMKAQQERYDEAKKWLKWNALMPLMEWAQKMYKFMWPFLQAISNGMKKANTYFVSFLDGSFKAFRPLYDLITGSGTGDVISTVQKVALAAFSGVANFLSTNLPKFLETAIPFIANAAIGFGKAFFDAVPIALQAVGTTLREAFKENIAVGVGIMAFLSFKLWKWIMDAGLQFKLSMRQWKAIETAIYRTAPSGGLPNQIGTNAPGKPGMLDKIIGWGKGPTGAMQKANAATDALSAMQHAQAAGKAGKIGMIAAKAGSLGKGVIGGAATGIKAVLGAGRAVAGGMMGSGAGVIPGLITTALLAGVQGFAAMSDDEYKKDQYAELTALEKHNMKKMEENGKTDSWEYKGLQERSKKIEEFKTLSAKREQGLLTQFENQRLDELEKERFAIDGATKWGLFWRGSIDGLTFGMTNLADSFGKANTAAGESAKFFTDQYKNAQDALKAMSLVDKDNKATKQKPSSGPLLEYDKSIIPLIKDINELRSKGLKDEEKMLKDQLAERIKLVAENYKTSGDMQKAQIMNELKMKLESGEMTADQLYKNIAMNAELSGAITNSTMGAKAFSETLRNLWNPEAYKETLKNLKAVQEGAKSEDERKKNLQGTINDLQKQLYKAKPDSWAAEEAANAQGVAKEALATTKQDNTNLINTGKTGAASFFGAMGDKKKMEEFNKKALEESSITGDNTKGIDEKTALMNQNLLAANNLAQKAGATGVAQLAVMRQQFQLRQMEIDEKLKNEGGWFGQLSDQDKKRLEGEKKMLAVLDDQFRLEVDKKVKEEQNAQKRHQQSMGGLGKIAKNTEKEPAAAQVDYIGNMLRYMGSNADLRTVGF